MDCNVIQTHQTRAIESISVIVITLSIRLQIPDHFTAVTLIIVGYNCTLLLVCD